MFCNFPSFIIPCKFFTPALADDLSLESEWQQVTSGLQDSSQYSSWPKKCWSLGDLCLSSNFQLTQALYQDFGYCSEYTNCNWYHHHFFVASLGLIFWPGSGDLFVSQNPREFYASHSPGMILVCAYNIW